MELKACGRTLIFSAGYGFLPLDESDSLPVHESTRSSLLHDNMIPQAPEF
jgi:hypothetical protein